jgi:uncharacterized protein YbcC (UPF0753/DUF2309 family)
MSAVQDSLAAAADEHWLAKGLAKARSVLPAQGPLSVFVQQNPLLPWQHLPFHLAVETAAEQRGTDPWLAMPVLQQAIQDGRITRQSIAVAIADEAAERAAHQQTPLLPDLPWPLGLDGTSWLQASLLLDPTPPQALDWLVAEGATQHWRADLPPEWAQQRVAVQPGALWQACLTRAKRGPALPTTDHTAAEVGLLPRHGNPAWKAALAESVEALVIRWAAAFLDQGAAWWPMPDRQTGLLRSVVAQWRQPGLPLHPLLEQLPVLANEVHEVARLSAANPDPEAQAETALALVFGHWQLPVNDWSDAVAALAQVLPGWAGMFARLGEQPLDGQRGGPAQLSEFLAVLGLAELAATQTLARSSVEASNAPMEQTGPHVDPTLAAAWRLWSLAQVQVHQGNWTLGDIDNLTDEAWLALQIASASLHKRDQQRVLQRALEAQHRQIWLDGLGTHRRSGGRSDPTRPTAAVLTCFDAREESLRRHLEDAAPDVLTFGVPGFFGIAVDYVPVGATEGQPLCPAGVTPRHEVQEVLVLQRRLASTRHYFGRWRHLASRHNRTAVGGALLSALGGALTALPLVLRILAPGHTDRLLQRRAAGRGVATRLQWQETGQVNPTTGRQIGFTAAERAERVAAMLQNCGLVKNLPPLVLVLAHGSTSLNNPHLSAYQCGACGGRNGGPNARLYAQWANDPEVRALLPLHNVQLGPDTWFVAGLHNTATDEVMAQDLAEMPAAFVPKWNVLWQSLTTALAHNAHERSRRFGTAPRQMSPQNALLHVRRRTVDMAEARPEYGNSTNALCVIGRRRWSRGLFLDRRAFVIGYDPTTDPAGSVLERIVAAAGPVGAGINLSYWYSAVDNLRAGAGTKLPHNVVSLLGVMDGHASDLRTGMSRQMIELHEPVRLLLVVETTPERLLAIASRQPEVAELIGNGWIQLVAMDPDTGAMARFLAGSFVPCEPQEADVTPGLPAVRQWSDWYKRGVSVPRGFLGPAVLAPA